MSNRPRVDHDVLHRQAQAAVLAGLLCGDDVDALVASVAPSHVPGSFTPDVAMLELAVTALDLASVSRSAPLEYEGLRERYLPKVEFRGRVEHRSSQYALYAAACMRGGRQPDLQNDAGWWQTPLWLHAVYATVIYGRAAADRRSTTLDQVARDLAYRHGLGNDVESRFLLNDDKHRWPALAASPAGCVWKARYRECGHTTNAHPGDRALV